MRITFLSAGNTPLTKKFERGAQKQLIKHNYPHVRNFSSETYEIKDLKNFTLLLQSEANANHCLLKGEIQRELINESRAGSTTSGVSTEWLCLDIDGLPGVTTVAEFLWLMPKEFRGVQHVIQYSASMGVDPKKGLSAHIFFQLDKPYFPAELKEWLVYLNHTVPILESNLNLARSNCVLKWPLDISVVQNDKLIYIAPPVLGKGVVDKLRGKRIAFVAGKAKLKPSMAGALPDANAKKTKAKINALRDKLDLPKRTRVDDKMVQGIMVACAPGTARVTQRREADDFIYLNINGGDSFGYYHPKNNFEFLYNFKGEPNYRIKEFLPDYYASLAVTPKVITPGIEYLAFLDPKEDQYYRGTYEAASGFYDIHRAGNVTKVQSFLGQHGQPVPENIPEWEVAFEFDNPTVVDSKQQFLNKYAPSEHMSADNLKRKVTTIPPTIKKVILHALGNDKDSYDYFLNWLAAIIQHRTKTGTAWILHGTQGTGKGLLFHNILTPLVGRDYASSTGLYAFEKEFNGFMEQSVFLLIDEAEISSLRNQEEVMAKLKSSITENEIPIRKMRTDYYNARNYTNIIIASNKHDAAQIDDNDRRFNVARRQEKSLKITDRELDKIKAELPNFASYLQHCKCNVAQARKPLINKDREMMQKITRDSNEAIADAVHKADFDFFFDFRPTEEDPATLALLSGSSSMPSYDEAMLQLFIHNRLTRDALRTLFYYINAVSFKTAHKATKFLAHKELPTTRIRVDGRIQHGYAREENINPLSYTKDAQAWLNKLMSQSKDKPKLRSVK